MHANTALPCAWALGVVLTLTGCASRGRSTTHPLDLPAVPAVVASEAPPALRAPSPPSVTLLRPQARPGDHRAVPLGRDETVQPALVAPAVETGRGDAVAPELAARHARPRTRAPRTWQLDVSPCVGGT